MLPNYVSTRSPDNYFFPVQEVFIEEVSPYFGTVVCFHGNGGRFPLRDYDSQRLHLTEVNSEGHLLSTKKDPLVSGKL